MYVPWLSNVCMCEHEGILCLRYMWARDVYSLISVRAHVLPTHVYAHTHTHTHHTRARTHTHKHMYTHTHTFVLVLVLPLPELATWPPSKG